jgi:hypothetical protein
MTNENVPGPLQRLLHRWFVQYNPLYLLSAALVLRGLNQISGALPASASLGVGALSELYALALIAGAALLTRIELRRPAVFVALIAVLYQGDLALGTENYALLAIGKWAALAWFALFVVKLRALAWALRLRLSTSALAVASFGAAGIAIVPQLSRMLGARALSSVVALWLFMLFASALWTSRVVTSERPLDAWGEKVLARSLRATWTIWGGLAFGHVLFWTWRYHLDARIFAPIALLLATRWIEQETRLVAAVVTTLSFAFVCAPPLLPLTALMSALVLALHALRKPHEPTEPEATEPPRDDYRAATEGQDSHVHVCR